MCKAPSTELPSRRPDAHAVTPRPAAEQAAKYYLKVMDKAAADGGFISKETARLQKMIDDGAGPPPSPAPPPSPVPRPPSPALSYPHTA